jgi:hypothetical protein
VTVGATDSSGAEMTYDPFPMATDEDPANPEASCTPASGGTFPLGTTTVNCLATDAAGNKAEDGFKVSVTYALAACSPLTEEAPRLLRRHLCVRARIYRAG